MPSEAKRGAVRILTNYARLGTTVVLGLVLVPVLYHGIGRDGFGLYALVGASVGFAQMFRDITRASMNRELGAAWHAASPDAFRNTYAAALALSLVLGLLSALTFAALALAVPLLDIPPSLHAAARWAIAAAGLSTLVTVLVAAPFNMFLVTERFVAYNVRQIAERLAYTGSAIVLLLVLDLGDPGSPSRGFVLFSVVSNAASIVVTLAAVVEIVRREPLLRPTGLRFDRASIRRVAGTSGWNAVTTTAMNLHLRVDALLMNLFFSLAGNAAFGLAMTLTSYVRMLTVGVTDGLDAVTARVSVGDKGEQGVRALLTHSTRLAAAIALPAGIFVLVLARPILDAWVGHRTPQSTESIEPAVAIVRALVIGMTVRAVTDNWMRVLYGSGHVARYGVQVLVGGVLNPLGAALYILLVDRQASLAPAFAFTSVMIGVHLLLLPRTARLALGLRYSDVLAPLARPVVATAAAAPVVLLAAWLIDAWNLAWIALAAAAFGATYSLLAWTLVLSPAERQRLMRVLRTRGQRKPSNSAREEVP